MDRACVIGFEEPIRKQLESQTQQDALYLSSFQHLDDVPRNHPEPKAFYYNRARFSPADIDSFLQGRKWSACDVVPLGNRRVEPPIPPGVWVLIGVVGIGVVISLILPVFCSRAYP